MAKKKEKPDVRLSLPTIKCSYQSTGPVSYVDLMRKIVLMMRMDDTEKGLVLAVLDNPGDTSNRLVYADWLEENDRPEEAAAEREAARLLNLPAATWTGSGMLASGAAYVPSRQRWGSMSSGGNF